ncbi:transglycosylase SLT domain-containing protein [Streptomyces sp. CA-111067]|uniref:transglycosylase SLT domain-containing protein n=1 Tax=Streptomyces sp. CA-111067 TaxID=3240046 RepID=UPI003D97F6DE
MRFSAIPKKLPAFNAFNRLSKKHKITVAGAAAAAAVVLSVTGLEATAGAGSATAAGDPAGFSVSQNAKGSSPLAGAKTEQGAAVKQIGPQAGMASQKAIKDAAQKKQDLAAASKKKAADQAAAATKKKADAAAATKAANAKAAAKKAAAAAAERAKDKQAANRSTKRVAIVAQPKKAAPKKAAVTKTYANNLDGWIRQSLDIMHAKGIPGSYEGIHRNIIRESSGNPQAINLWDINAQNGIPSKGLLQVIQPTFNTYHVSGTSMNIYDPVANITAACNYAADRYGSMDNVNSAY